MNEYEDEERRRTPRLSSATLHELVQLSLRDMRGSTTALESAIKNGEPTEALLNRLHQTSEVLSAVMKETLDVES